MPNIKKIKAQSTVVSIAFLIVTVVLFIAIAYPPIKKMIESPSLSPDSCFDRGLEHSISIGTSCYNPTTNNLEVVVTKNNGENPSSTVFKLTFENETLYWQCCSNCTGCKTLVSGTKTYHFFPTRLPKTVTIITDDCNRATKEVVSC